MGIGYIIGLGFTNNTNDIMYEGLGYYEDIIEPHVNDISFAQDIYRPSTPVLSGNRNHSSSISLDISPAAAKYDIDLVTPVTSYEIQISKLTNGEFLDTTESSGGFLSPSTYWSTDLRPDNSEPAYTTNATVSYIGYPIVSTDAPIATSETVLNYEYALCHTIDNNESLELWISTDGDRIQHDKKL